MEVPPTLTIPVRVSPYPSVTEDPIPIVEENWAHPLDRMGYLTPSLDFDVLDGAVTKLGKAISLVVGMAVVESLREFRAADEVEGAARGEGVLRMDTNGTVLSTIIRQART